MLQRLLELEFQISIPVLLIALLGMLFIFLSINRIRQRRIFSAGLAGAVGLCLFCLGMLSLAVALNLYTYQRLTHEQTIAVLTFRLLGPQRYNVVLKRQDKVGQFQLDGDEWQLDARILRWQPPVQLLGLNSLYRLERISGRYQDLALERNEPRTIYMLATHDGLDIWSLARRYHAWLPWVDAYYGSATYLPMQDNARYTVAINQYGLIARPDNVAAEQAASSWK